MDTEPPEGDDLQRMLVSMKQDVLARATPRPRRRRLRPGLVVGVVGLLAVGTVTGAVALSLQQRDEPVAAPTQTQQPEPAPSETAPTSAPITASLTPAPAPTTAAVIPTTCRDTVPGEDYDRLFGATPVTEITDTDDSSTGTDDEEIVWANGRVALNCTWMDPRADVSGLSLRIGTAGPGAADVLADSTLRCEDRNGGRVCQGSTPADPYPVDRVTTYFLRGDTFVVVSQTNFPTNGLLDAVVRQVWGD